MMENDWMCNLLYRYTDTYKKKLKPISNSSSFEQSERGRWRERNVDKTLSFTFHSTICISYGIHIKSNWMVQSMWFNDGMFTFQCVRVRVLMFLGNLLNVVRIKAYLECQLQWFSNHRHCFCCCCCSPPPHTIAVNSFLLLR